MKAIDQVICVETSARSAGSTKSRARIACQVTVCMLIVSGMVFLTPPVALANSGRSFVRQLTGTPTGPGGATAPFSGVGGVATDAAGNLWVGETDGADQLDEFSSSGTFLGPQPGPAPLMLNGGIGSQGYMPPASVSMDEANNRFYVTAPHTSGGFPPRIEVFDNAGSALSLLPLTSWQFGSPAHVVVDNGGALSDPSAGSVYVSHGNVDPASAEGDGLPRGVERFNGSGEPVAYTGSATYISGNDIVGTPTENFGEHDRPAGVAVDSHGDIYVAVNVPENDPEIKNMRGVYEYAPSGEFVQVFTGAETPPLKEIKPGEKGFGGELRGVAVDPATGNVLVAVTAQITEGAVDEFDSSGKFVGQLTETTRGSLLGAMSELAVDASGQLYVVDNGHEAVDVFAVSHISPGVKLYEPSGRTGSSIVVNGSVNPAGQELSECYFEVVPRSQFEISGFGAVTPAEKDHLCLPGPGGIPQDEVFHSVSAEIAGLAEGVTYEYRLVASIGGALGGISDSEALAFTISGVPTLESSSVANISSAFAELRGGIASHGVDTSYRFEYDTREYVGDERHGVSVPLPDGDVGVGGPSGGAIASVRQVISGLSPDTIYFYRVVASNEVGAVIGAFCEGELRPDCAFATLPSSDEGLPDGRVYELLSPPNKGSAEDMFGKPPAVANQFANDDAGYPSNSGNEFLMETKAAFGGFAASGQNAYVFRRDEMAKAWKVIPLASEALGVQSVLVGAFDPTGFGRVGIFDNVGSKASPSGVARISLIGPPGGGPGGSLYEQIMSEATLPSEAGEGRMIAGASPDLGGVVVEVKEAGLLAPGQYQGSTALYEWSKGNFALVSIGPDGQPFGCGARLGQGVNPGASHNAVSEDGKKLFMTAPDPYTPNPDVSSGCWNSTTEENTPQIYMRSGGTTVQISRPNAGVSDPVCPKPEEACRPAIYVGASEDGSRVFFITESELTKDAEELKLHDTELYEYSADTGAVKRVSAGEGGSPAHEPGTSGAHVINVPAVAASGSAVYFSAYGALAQAAPTLTGKLPESPVNVYRYDTTSGDTRYVATVEGRDYPGNTNGTWWVRGIVPELFEGVALAPTANWNTTPDGRYLLFATTHELTNSSTIAGGPCPVMDNQDSTPSGHCAEVYRFDANLSSSEGVPGVANNPMCLSCDPSGVNPVSDAFFAHSAATTMPAGGEVRAISDDGSYAFFDTADPLVRQDGNHTNDVYEWEDHGHGGCARIQGCVHLVSSGQDFAPSFFLGSSADGKNVFFGTHAQLVSQDTDNAGDLYDARVDGFPPGPPKSPPCEGDACQNPPPSPIDSTPASFSFSGAGNVVTERQGQKVTLTGAQKLVRALRACKKHKRRNVRKRCQSQARKRYGGRAARRPMGAGHAKSSGRAGR